MSQPGIASFDQVDPQDIWRKDRDHFLHPWTHFDSFKKDGSLVMGRGEGAFVYDIAGKRYLDGIAGLWCVNMGYGREEIVAAIADQARRLAFFNPFVDTTNVPAAELAARLAGLAPGALNHVFFTCGGSTANDTAVRLIQYYQSRRGKRQKRHLISRHDAYHGSTFLTGSISGKPGDRSPHLDFIEDWVHHVSAPNVYRRPKGMTRRRILRSSGRRAGGQDPGDRARERRRLLRRAGAGRGRRHRAAGGLSTGARREVCRRYDVLYISDEVVTGFGRLGHMFASQDVFGIEPDILVCAKGLTSGYQPLGACIFSDEIYEVISARRSRWLVHQWLHLFGPSRRLRRRRSPISRSWSARISAAMSAASGRFWSSGCRRCAICRSWAMSAAAIS